jgi:hypothetical protein
MACVSAGDLLHRQAVRDEVAAGPTDALGEGQREEPEPRHPRHELVRKVAGLVVMRGPWRDLCLREIADSVADLPLLVAEIEVHCG